VEKEGKGASILLPLSVLFLHSTRLERRTGTGTSKGEEAGGSENHKPADPGVGSSSTIARESEEPRKQLS